MGALTLPGDIPDLLRRGSPVVVTDPDGCHYSGVVSALSDGPYVTMQALGGEQSPWTAWIPGWAGASVALDLTEATGRTHAVWRLARALLPAAPASYALSAQWNTCVHVVACGPSWQMTTRVDTTTFGPRGRWIEVPALAYLDHDVPWLLPDGSRWLDAEALRLVFLHVAGRAP